MATRELRLRKIATKQLDTQNWGCSFQELHKFAVFSTRGVVIWHYMIY